MTVLNGARNFIHQEEVQYKKIVSERLASVLGESINFINTKQYDTIDFRLNGEFWRANINNFDNRTIDGVYICPFDIEIFGCSIACQQASTLGPSTFDILKGTAGSFSSAGTIFSSVPTIATNAIGYGYALQVENVGIVAGSGYNAGTFITPKVTMNAGDLLELKLLSASKPSQNFSIQLYFRPI
jgi:hypothetical protein